MQTLRGWLPVDSSTHVHTQATLSGLWALKKTTGNWGWEGGCIDQCTLHVCMTSQTLFSLDIKNREKYVIQ